MAIPVTNNIQINSAVTSPFLRTVDAALPAVLGTSHGVVNRAISHDIRDFSARNPAI